MKKLIKALVLIAMISSLIFLSGCSNNDSNSGENKSTQKNDVNAKKELGALWEDLKAGEQEVYSKLRDKKFVIPIAIECISDSISKNDGGKFSLLAFTPLESVSLVGPQEIILMVLPEGLEEIKKFNSPGKFIWGHLTVIPGQKLSGNKLVLSLVPDSKVELKADNALWEITTEQWEKIVKPKISNLDMALTAYHLDKHKFTTDMSELSKYGYQQPCWPEISVETDGKDSFKLYTISPDGKYRLTYDSQLNYSGGFLPIEEISKK